MAGPRVSVIVTTYNRKEYLKKTIQSILDQTFTDFELIVVDNFSDYNFFEVVEGFGDHRIKAYQNQNNGIIAVNRNYGIGHASGEYLAFCDDDDMWQPNKLGIQIDYITNHPQTIVSSNCSLINHEGEIIGSSSHSQYKKTTDIYKANHIFLSSVIVRNSGLISFDENIIYVGIEDYALWVKLINHNYSCYICQEKLLMYRDAQSNTSQRLKVFRPIKTIALFSSIYVQYGKMSAWLYCFCIAINLLWFFYYIIRRHA